MEMRKKRTLTGLFIRYLCFLCINTILLGLFLVLVFAGFMKAGVILPANYMETWMNDNRDRIVNAERVTEELFPQGSRYGVYSASEGFLYGSFDEEEQSRAWGAYLDNNVFAENSGFYRFFLRESGEICIVKYFIRTQVANKFLGEHLPAPDICILLLFFVLFFLQIVLVSRHFARTLSKRLKVLNAATEKIRCQDLEIEESHSDIREIDEVLVSLFRMGKALRSALNEQWRLEKDKREQVAALAHDIKTPLTVIKGNAELLEEEVSDASAKEYNRYIRENVTEIENYLLMLQEMLLSEEEKTEAAVIDAEEMAELLTKRAETLAAGYSGGRLGIETKTERGGLSSVKIVCDIGQIQRAWDNIVSNALEHTPPGEIRPLLTAAEKIVYSGETYLAVRMLDRGEGFTKEELRRAGEQFYQGDKSRHKKNHRGLGLYTASRFAARQGGKILLENAMEEGYGGKVSLLLKLSEIQD